MANLTELLAALSNLPQIQGGPPLLPSIPSSPTVTPDTSVLPPFLTMPEAPPPAPSAPLDQNIMRQVMALLPPQPTPPPPPAPIGALGRIALALQGFGAGVQGVGPQFLAQLQAQREAPQREYQARLDEYNQQKARLGLTGLQMQQSAEERRQERENRAAENQFQRDFQQAAARMKFTDDVAKLKLEDAMMTERQAKIQAEVNERQRVMLEAQDKAKRAQRMVDLAKLGATPAQAKNIVDAEYGDAELNPSSDKALKLIQARIERLQSLATGRTTAAAAEPLQAVLENGMSVPASLVDKKRGSVEIGGKTVNVVGYSGKGVSGTATAPPNPFNQPAGFY